jgi:WD40 repeat protein
MRRFKVGGKQVKTLAYSRDGRALAAFEGPFLGIDVIHFWDLAEGKNRYSIPVEGEPVALSDNWRLMATVPVSEEPSEPTVYVRNAEPSVAAPLATFLFPGDVAADVATLAFDPAGKTVVVGYYTIEGAEQRFWIERRVVSGSQKPVRLASEGPPVCFAFTADGHTLACGRADNIVTLWNLQKKKAVADLPQKAWARTEAFSPEGRTLAATAGLSVTVWDVARAEQLFLLKGHKKQVNGLSFHPGGRTLATAGHDSTVRLWDLRSGKERACYDWKIGKVHSVCFAPDGMTAAAGGEKGAVVIWDVED